LSEWAFVVFVLFNYA